MKRKLIALSMTLALLVSALAVIPVGAHPVAVDGSRSEWFGVEPDTSGVGMVARNATEQGEWVFNDSKKDQRWINATSNITREADLDWVNITGDSAGLGLLARVERYSGVTNDPPLELMFTIDTTQDASGQKPLPATAGVSVTNDAAWEYVVDVAITGNADPLVANTGPGKVTIWKNSAATPTSASCNAPTCEARVVNAAAFQGSFVEVRIPWSRFDGSWVGGAKGVKPTPDKPWRFTVSTYYNQNPRPVIISDANPSKVIDILGDKSTIDDLNDSPANTINRSFDVYFNTTGEVYSPLQITEFQPNPPGQDDPTRASATDSEWVEIYNPNAFQVDLSKYKIGDAKGPNSSVEAMLQFPANSTIAAGKFVIVARDKSKFNARYGANPNGATVYGVSQLSTAWGSGGSAKFDLANGPSGTTLTFQEEVVLLDAKDSIVDMVNYAWPNTTSDANSEPIVISEGSEVGEGISYERCPATFDTNNNRVDFAIHPTVLDQTPGKACVAIQGVDLSIAKSGPQNVDSTVDAAPIQYILKFDNIGAGPNPANAVVISDTLPADVTFASQESMPPATFTQTGKTLKWAYTTLEPGATGMITVNVTLNTGIAPNTQIDNTATIASTPSEDLALYGENNSSTATVFTLGPADLSVSSNVHGPIAPGGEFLFDITYKNSGQNDANDATITAVLPPNVTILDSAGGGSPSGTTGTVTWNVGTVPPDGQIYSIVVRAKLANTVLPDTPLPFSFSITVPSGDPTPTDNAYTAPDIVAGLNQLYLPRIMR
ncbi:MAG: lamin tail domain-containing protein [Kouleothrix sp.]|nr:lamin tail domain-containing protein [Kouleothrix sp.]